MRDVVYDNEIFCKKWNIIYCWKWCGTLPLCWCHGRLRRIPDHVIVRKVKTDPRVSKLTGISPMISQKARLKLAWIMPGKDYYTS